MSTRFACAAALLLCLTPVAADAQTIEWLGTRALGMGGAFVAVADDATAVYWNPAGLATGATVSGVFEIGRSDALLDKARPIGPGANGTRLAERIVATTGTSFGVSQYRLGFVELKEPATAGGASMLTRLSTTHYGATLVQTVSEGLVVGGTLKLIRGKAAVADAAADANVDAALETGEDLATRGTTAFDLDAGLMLVMGIARAGLVVRNLREPEFKVPDGSPGSAVKLRRHTRAGIAVTPGRSGAAPGAGTTIGVDFDITKMETPRGRQRSLALGGEQWLFGRYLGVRAGARWNALDWAQRATSVGLSVAVRRGSYVDAHASRGRVADDRSWGIAARVTF